MPLLISKSLILPFLMLIISGCGLFEKQLESADKIIQKASKQKIFFAPYDLVWKAAHHSIKYTIASENQDFGVIETDYIKAVDGWLPPNKTKPDYKSARYKLIFTFAKGKIDGRDSTRVTIDKKIEIFRDFISEKQVISSDGLEELALFYRIEREIIIEQALKKASESPQSPAGRL
ncbi:MAG: hypothetical protein A2622_01620 [Bdellovibrionales bacterium RIFCSPHIGHO2_01_FULL_40_29]|nr:MAG: hypothetical protein A2622_01620 [Bdellovibrionales bacterium RIFCSPHIGHO2_01_FULL_40_29]OFZ33794.1 MAG: hypothetical protein A3D17_02040 [Bdellovibrionales bacterium RIFCSPHIGHO2_02_FULL_40_15]